MKRILLALAIIVSITACTKPETPNPEPEPIPESYVGYKRSEHPNIKIPGISVNDEIIYDLKSACSICWDHDKPISTTYVTSEMYTYSDFMWSEINDFTPKAVIYISGNRLLSLSILDNEIIHYDASDQSVKKADNVESFKAKHILFAIDIENLKTNTCEFDVEVVMRNGDIIEIVYYGEYTYIPVFG